MRGPTLLDIARATGLSRSAVAYGLKNSRQVSAETAAKVQMAAEKLGYRPNLAAAELAMHRVKGGGRRAPLVAYVYNHDDPNKTRRVFPEHLENHLTVAGASMIREDARKYKSLQHMARVLNSRGIDGILYDLKGILGTDPFPLGKQLPVVAVNNHPGLHRVQYPQVRMDLGRAVRRSWSEAVARGYERIGAVIHSHDPPVYDDYTMLGAVEAARAQYGGGSIAPCTCQHLDQEGFHQWFRSNRPDALVTLNLLPYWWLSSRPEGLPKNLGLTSLFLPVGPMSRDFTGFLPADSQIADLAVRLLISFIQTRPDPDDNHTRSTLVLGDWNAGDTFPPRNSNAIIN